VTAVGAVRIRPGTVADVPAMRALGTRAWRAAHEGPLTPRAIDDGIAEFWNEWSLGSAARSGRILVAERDGHVAGLLESDTMADGRPVVWKLSVAPEAQRAGIGRALLNAHLARLRADGAGELWLEHHEGNAAADAFCDAVGFERRGVEESAGARVVWRALRV
jgi:ribosomal protein S18 acetylase RimI-like enzyme